MKGIVKIMINVRYDIIDNNGITTKNVNKEYIKQMYNKGQDQAIIYVYYPPYYNRTRKEWNLNKKPYICGIKDFIDLYTE